ncbi:MAG: sugar transferase [Ruminococcus sp.]
MEFNLQKSRAVSFSGSADKPKYELLIEKKPCYDAVKRAFDIVASVTGLVVLSVPMAVISLAIFIDDPGNPIFVQERTGMNGRKFKIYKFRTMVKNAEQLRNSEEFISQNQSDGPLFKIKNDKRILKSGNILRKLSLDELPQLWNILKGDMSVIGPRPFIPKEQEGLIPERLLVKPGLSCYWQIQHTPDMPIDEQMLLDLKYIHERSMITDFKLIVKTIGVVIRGKNC